MQKQWIGKSTGTRVRFYLKKEEEEIKEKETKEERGERERREEEEEGKDFVEVYTTSIETIFGVSFLGISPSSPLLSKMSLTSSNRQVFFFFFLFSFSFFLFFFSFFFGGNF